MTLPTEPGRYYWTEWRCYIEVQHKGAHLYVTPPGGVPVRITKRIAGKFLRRRP